MASIRVEIKNLAQIKSAFRQAPQLTTREMNTAIKQSILTIAGESAARSPVLTGRLRASHFDASASLFRNLYGSVGPVANYAIFVHQGTRFMRGRPFLFEAVKAKEATVQKFFSDGLARVMKKIAKDTG